MESNQHIYLDKNKLSECCENICKSGQNICKSGQICHSDHGLSSESFPDWKVKLNRSKVECCNKTTALANSEPKS